jgi:hypothetical protein
MRSRQQWKRMQRTSILPTSLHVLCTHCSMQSTNSTTAAEASTVSSEPTSQHTGETATDGKSTDS